MVAARYPTGAAPTSRYTIGCPRCDFRHAPAPGNNCFGRYAPAGCQQTTPRDQHVSSDRLADR